MIKFPSKDIKNANFNKLKSKSKNRMIFNDKIINRKTEPTLFNVQAAAMAMQSNQNIINIRSSRRLQAKTDMAQIAEDTLFMMNIAIDNTTKDFSLLEDNNVQKLESNPNIMDKQQANDILNTHKSIDKYFDNTNDPILNLDDGNNSTAEYKLKTNEGINISDKDLSKILSEINILNQSNNYFGKNKYYL